MMITISCKEHWKYHFLYCPITKLSSKKYSNIVKDENKASLHNLVKTLHLAVREWDGFNCAHMPLFMTAHPALQDALVTNFALHRDPQVDTLHVLAHMALLTARVVAQCAAPQVVNFHQEGVWVNGVLRGATFNGVLVNVDFVVVWK